MMLMNFVNGEFTEEGMSFGNINPVNGMEFCQVAEASRATVDEAVMSAREALNGGWSGLSPKKGAEWLTKIASGIERRFDDFVAAEVADTGRPAVQARTLDVPRAIENFRFFAKLATSDSLESYETRQPDGRYSLNYAYRKPLGVVGVISPWNLPLLLLTWKVAPALVTGNTVVAKPSEETPYTATLLAEVMQDVGLPKGVFNVVHGFGPDSAGEFLAAHEDVDAITFTGESNTGSAIMRAAAGSLKALSFELGGKNAAIVFADADFEDAVSGVARSSFTNCGQVCLCTERVYVQSGIFDRFVDALKKKTESIAVGLPFAGDTEMGPLISFQHREKVLAYFDLARKDGATVITGGKIPDFGDERNLGAFVAPTIWTGLTESARCVKEEIFGPVCHLSPFDDEDEAVAMANNTEYGLASSIWTQSLSRAHRVAQQMRTGIAWVNTWYLRDLRTPFGGFGRSGIGREGGKHSLDFYSQPTNICLQV